MEVVERVKTMLQRPRSAADFSPAARYAVQELTEYAENEHDRRMELEGKASEYFHGMMESRKENASKDRTIDDLRQQLSFLRETITDAGM